MTINEMIEDMKEEYSTKVEDDVKPFVRELLNCYKEGQPFRFTYYEYEKSVVGTTRFFKRGGKYVLEGVELLLFSLLLLQNTTFNATAKCYEIDMENLLIVIPFNECGTNVFEIIGNKGKEETYSNTDNNIRHPQRYAAGGKHNIECYKAIEYVLDNLHNVPEKYFGHVANVMKYVWRCNHKNGYEDLDKTAAYLDFMFED